MVDFNVNVNIEVIDDFYYGVEYMEDFIDYDMIIFILGFYNLYDIKFGFYIDFLGYFYFVYNLEYGDIIIYYCENVSDDLKEYLKYLIKFCEVGVGILVVLNKDILEGSEVVVMVWIKMMKLDIFDDVKVGIFINWYIN